MEAALAQWTSPKLLQAVAILGDASLAARRDADTGKPAAARALWTLARLGRAGGRE